MEHERRLVSESQWYTPPDLASRLWDWCHVLSRRHVPFRVLEPSAGDGALIRPMLAGKQTPDEVVAYEVDPARLPALRVLDTALVSVDVRPWDFLADANPGRFDLAVTNPPYERDQDVDFTLRTLECSTAAVGIYRSALVHGAGRWNRLWRHVDIRRMAWLSSRPRFGGEHQPMTDFVALHLVRRSHARKQGEAHTLNVEWWT
jgi:predicted RNA methylase